MDRRLRPAVAVSVLMHLALVVALARVAPTLPSPADPDKRSIVVGIAITSPQRRIVPPAPVTPANTPALPDPVDAASPDNVSLASTTTPAPINDATPPLETGAGDEDEIVLDMAALRNSINSHMTNYRRNLLGEEMEECHQYRDRYERWDCPEEGEVKSATQALIDEDMDDLFTDYVSGYARNARISTELLADMETLRPLMEDEGVLGTLARERYYLKHEQYVYLNPDEGKGEADVVTLVTFSLSPKGLVLNGFGGVLSIGFDGEIKSGAQVRAPARHFDEE